MKEIKTSILLGMLCVTTWVGASFLTLDKPVNSEKTIGQQKNDINNTDSAIQTLAISSSVIDHKLGG